ncbi:carbohydrate ABC transporter permease [Martelella radicis]|uniref:Raffinose/stachyose/melibiose transport system permease protein n=1 Tax=Martelella radicis TaxID=1397476 RepID=A0A7W6P9Q2_9HYPH|nr:carbohydrate ABC transporter permease [Martelella radicis]MBB4120612.1 raffinose/stachyose/melibiose transport system permease protein [Martelella radicis]
MNRFARNHFDWRDALRISVLLLVAATILLPLTATVLGGFKTTGELRVQPFSIPSTWHTEFYANVLSDPNFWHYLWNSFFIAVMTVIITLLFGSMAAYVFSHIRFFGASYILSYLLLGMMFPFAAAIVPLFIKIRDIGLLDTPWGVILPQTAFGLGFSILLFKTFFDQLPGELFEAARMDGCTYTGFFFRFTLPLSTPILGTVAVFVFVSSWNNYLLPLIVLNSTDQYPWTLGMMQYRGEYIVEWNRILAFVTLTLTPAVIFFLAAQRYIVAGLTGGAVKG